MLNFDRHWLLCIFLFSAQLKQATIEDSILMDQCQVQGVQLSQSLIGQGARVSGHGAARLHLGDQCLVELK